MRKMFVGASLSADWKWNLFFFRLFDTFPFALYSDFLLSFFQIDFKILTFFTLLYIPGVFVCFLLNSLHRKNRVGL